MKKLSRISAFFVFFLLSCFLFSTTASAYIDPSAMTYIVQIIVGIVIAGGAAFAFYFRKIKRKFRKKGTKEVDYVTKDTVTTDSDDEFDDSHLNDDDFDDYDEKK